MNSPNMTAKKRTVVTPILRWKKEVRGGTVSCEVLNVSATVRVHMNGCVVGIHSWRRHSRVCLGLHAVPVMQPVDDNEEEGVGTKSIWRRHAGHTTQCALAGVVQLPGGVV